MLKRKISKSTVIRGQKEVIQAQNILIEWLLRKVDRQRKRLEPLTTKESQLDDFVCDPALYV